VPTIVSRNTGHLDLVGIDGVCALDRGAAKVGQWTEWGESDVEEIVHQLEIAYRNWQGELALLYPLVRLDGLTRESFQWADVAAQLAALARVAGQPAVHGGKAA